MYLYSYDKIYDSVTFGGDDTTFLIDTPTQSHNFSVI